MTKVTFFFDEDLIKKSRKYARSKGKSLNELITELLLKELGQQNTNWFDYVFDLMDKTNANSGGKIMEREDLYKK